MEVSLDSRRESATARAENEAFSIETMQSPEASDSVSRGDGNGDENLNKESDDADRELYGPNMPPVTDALKATLKWKNFLPEVLNIIFSVLFLGLAISLVKLKGHVESDWARRVVDASKLAPSLWPVLFSTVLGGATTALARWHAERGAQLRVIEQLMVSQTVFSSIRGAVLFRMFGIQTAILLLLWSFSPIGSQAPLRSVYLRNNTITGTLPGSISYSNGTFDSDIDLASSRTTGTTFQSQTLADILFSISITLPGARTQYTNDSSAAFKDLVLSEGVFRYQDLASDRFQNVRIPHVQSLPGYDNKNPDKWIDVPYNSQVVNYASLLGIPVSGRPRDFTGNIHFSMAANYHDFQCDPIHAFKLDSRTNDTWLQQNFPQYNLLGGNQTANGSDWSGLLQQFEKIGPGNFLLRIGNQTTSTVYFMYYTEVGSAYNFYNIPELMSNAPPYNIQAVKCGATVTNVLANVTCAHDSGGMAIPCVVNRAKIVSTSNRTSFSQLYQLESYQSLWLEYSFPVLSLPLGTGGNGKPTSPIPRFIYDPVTFESSSYALVPLVNITTAMFQKRFGLLYNTAWRAITTGIDLTNRSFNSQATNVLAQFTSPAEPTYVLNNGWIATHFIATFILLLTSVFTIALKAQLIGPDSLGYVSSILRDSRHFADGRIRSTMDGDAISRILGKQRVMLGDIEGPRVTGRVAFTNESLVYRLRCDKAYT